MCWYHVFNLLYNHRLNVSLNTKFKDKHSIFSFSLPWTFGSSVLYAKSSSTEILEISLKKERHIASTSRNKKIEWLRLSPCLVNKEIQFRYYKNVYKEPKVTHIMRFFWGTVWKMPHQMSLKKQLKHRPSSQGQAASSQCVPCSPVSPGNSELPCRLLLPDSPSSSQHSCASGKWHGCRLSSQPRPTHC